MCETKRIFIIGDEAADLEYILPKAGVLNEARDSPCLTFEVYPFIPNRILIEIFIFPRDRDLKPYCSLYVDFLAKPDLIIYAVDRESSPKEMVEWLRLFQQDNTARVVFFSDARSYLERQQIFSKVNPLFHREVSEFIFFPNIDTCSVATCFCNIGEVGIFMQNYASKIPISARMRWAWQKLTHRLFGKKSECDSVI